MVVSGNAEDRLMVRDIKLNSKGSWFEGNYLTLEEILKMVAQWCRNVDYKWYKDVDYLWCKDMLSRKRIRFEVDISRNTVVDWDTFRRQICEVNFLECEEKIGGPGERVQIDESNLVSENIKVVIEWEDSGCLVGLKKEVVRVLY